VPLSRKVNDDNTVTHFISNNKASFELQFVKDLNSLFSRANEQELIFYDGSRFYEGDLSNLENIEPELITNKMVLIGDLGRDSNGNLVNFKNAHITPLNEYYGEATIPDMYEIEISANIITQIHHSKYLNEIGLVLKTLFLLGICLLHVALLSLTKTKWLVVTLILNSIQFIFLMIMAPICITLLLLFANRYYLEINEFPLLLITTTLFTVILNVNHSRATTQK